MDAMNDNHYSNDGIAKKVSGLDQTEVKRELMDQVFEQKVPSSDRFTWSDPKNIGNGDCKLKDDATAHYYDKASGQSVECTGKEFNERMKRLYGTDTVHYNSKEPDFTPFEQRFSKKEMDSYLENKYGKENLTRTKNDVPGHVEVSKITGDRQTTQKEATGIIAEKTGLDVKEIREYMKVNGITWHECGDGKTVRAVPTEVNSVYGHTGGIGLSKDLHAAGEVFKKNRDGLDGTPGHEISAKEYIDKHRDELIQEKKNIEKNNSISKASKMTKETDINISKHNSISQATKSEKMVDNNLNKSNNRERS